MRRVTNILGLALFLLGCSLMPGPVTLLTGGGEACHAGPQATVEGVLIADPQSGTAVNVERSESEWGVMPAVGSIVRVIWPTDYTGRRLFGGEVEVLDASDQVVATTGRKVVLGQQASFGETDGAFAACGGSEVP